MKNSLSQGLLIFLTPEGVVEKGLSIVGQIPDDDHLIYKRLTKRMDKQKNPNTLIEPRYVVTLLCFIFNAEDEGSMHELGECLAVVMRNRPHGRQGFKGQWIVITNGSELIVTYPDKQDFEEAKELFREADRVFDWEHLNVLFNTIHHVEGASA